MSGTQLVACPEKILKKKRKKRRKHRSGRHASVFGCRMKYNKTEAEKERDGEGESLRMSVWAGRVKRGREKIKISRRKDKNMTNNKNERGDRMFRFGIAFEGGICPNIHTCVYTSAYDAVRACGRAK